MQISDNTTGMEAGISVATDKEGRDFCVVVVKGTFFIEENGALSLAEEQAPLIYADEHYGDPGETCIKYECDFAPFKPRADVLVNGHACSTTGNPVTETTVGITVGHIRKQVKVYGDRLWREGANGIRATAPQPFIKMPLTYDRAFGGSDNSHPKPKNQGAELRNPVGTGFFKNADPRNINNKPLPNLEDPDKLIRSWSDIPAPAGLGIVGRGWQPRISYAGTYDKTWLDDCFPFLPNDFDEQYFLSAPMDQQLPSIRGGETVQCINMTPQRVLAFTVPEIEFPVAYHFRDRTERQKPVLDTLLIEPDDRRVLMTWRTRIPLGRKLNALREIKIGREPAAPRTDSGKPHFKSIPDFMAWKNER